MSLALLLLDHSCPTSSPFSRRQIPLLVRRGGCGIKKFSAMPSLAPQTGWSLTPYVSLQRERPPRPLQITRLRGIFLLSRPPLLARRGIRSFRTDTSQPHNPASYSRWRIRISSVSDDCCFSINGLATLSQSAFAWKQSPS